MTEDVARAIVQVAGLYLVAGAAFAIPFVIFAIGRIDPAARDSGWGFRLIVLPGSIAFWPVLAWRLLRGAGSPPAEHNAHRDAAGRDA